MSSELAVREMILGVLKSKDVSGRNVIHSSDFRTAITDLGYPMGSSVVENILVHCKLDAIGNLDFSELERELVRQRRVLQANKKPEHKVAATSSGAVSKPWRADVAHKAKVEAERQMRMVSEHNTEINKVYAALSHHEISANDALNALYSMEIAPTKAFMKVLQNMTINDVSYSEFIKSLTKFDPNASDLDDQQVFAGSAPNRGDVSFISDHQSKRISGNTRSAFFQTDAANADVKPKPFRKMTSANSTGVTDAMIFKTQATKEVIFSGDDTIPLLSHNQLDMVEGTMGESVSVNFNSELKLQREQVLAALRKLDAGVISMDDFQDMLFSMGMDLPETMITSIRRAVVSGRMDIRHFVKLLDASIFKSTAIEDRVRDDDVHSLQAKFRRGVMRFGVDAITNLALVFRKMDSDQDGSLTFTEFRQGCNKLQLLSSASSQRNKNITSSSSQGRRDTRASNDQLSDEELRTLFHAFDSNGDGVLQYHELLQALMGQLSAKRRAIIRKAFQKLDRHAEDKLLIDTIAEHFNASQHPLVLANERSEREVTSDLVHWLTNAMPSSLSSESKSKSHHSGSRNGTSGEDSGSFDGYVSYPVFEEYFASLSAAIDDDAAFEAMMTGCFQLSSKAAAPPVFRLRQGAQHSNATPMAIQTHGDCIAWQQEASIIEEQSRQQRKEGRRIIGGYQRNNSHHTNVVNWHNHGGETKSRTFFSLC